MPFRSESQRKLFHAKADRGEISPKVVHEWEHATHNKSKLPEHVKKTAAQIADEVLAKMGLFGTGLPINSPVTGKNVNSLDEWTKGGLFHNKVKTWEQKQNRGPKLAATLHPGAESQLWRFPQEAQDAMRKQVAGMGPGTVGFDRHIDSGTGQVTQVSLSKPKLGTIADEVLAKLGANVARGIGVFSAGKGGPKALERVMHRETPMQHKPSTSQSQPIEWRKSIGEKPKGESEMLKFFSLKEAAVDPEVMEAVALKASGSGASKLWQGLTGLSDDVLMAGMNIKQKMDRTKQREKHAAEQVVSSLSMLTKMSDVAKKEKLQGGKADEKPDSEFDPKQLEMGEQVEKEHTDDPQIAKEVAKDHLSESGAEHYYTELKKMEGKMEEKAAQEGLLQEQPMQATSPMSSLPPDILQLLKVQALVDQAKTAAPNDPGDIQRPYQRERENEEPEAPDQEQVSRQAMYERQLAEQMRAQKVEHEYTSRVRRGELAGAVGGMGAGAGLGFLLGKPGSRFAPMAVGGALTGLLGKGLGRHVGQQQGLDYLKEYSGTPWAVQ